MNLPDYAQSPFPVREDLVKAHQKSWQQISQPGSNWTATERVNFVEESRQAANCTLCQSRKQALSPVAVKGDHDHLALLTPSVVEIIHKMSTDPGRISRQWFDDVMSMDDLGEAQYVEVVGVIATSIAISTFHETLGLGQLPAAPLQTGDVSGEIADAVTAGEAWVPIMKVAEGSQATANIMRALALIPAEQKNFWRVKRAHYMNTIERAVDESLADTLSRPQIEFIAARISALNECFY